jgi:hypothetical protein
MNFTDFFSEIKEHFGHYLALFFILAFGVGALVFFQRTPQMQIVSLFLTSTFYVLWGIVHHYLEGDLHIKVVVEYATIAMLGFLILWSIIVRT